MLQATIWEKSVYMIKSLIKSLEKEKTMKLKESLKTLKLFKLYFKQLNVTDQQ